MFCRPVVKVSQQKAANKPPKKKQTLSKHPKTKAIKKPPAAPSRRSSRIVPTGFQHQQFPPADTNVSVAAEEEQ